MQSHAYTAMQDLQERHWWWRGMRRLYRASLRRLLPAHSRQRLVIDVGCGFGANLPVLETAGDVVGVDVSLEALRSIPASQRPTLGLVQAHADALPFRAGAFDVIGLLAVVEHVERDDAVVAETHRIARRGGIQLLLTSAFMLLWSHHDVANLHQRRYRARQLDCLQRDAGWRVLHTSYVNACLFPAALLIRRIQRRIFPAGASAYDMGPDLGPFNRLMEGLLCLEAWLIARWRVRLPFGIDLFSVSRRED